MILSNSLLKEIVDTCGSSKYLSRNDYDDHISFIYPTLIIKIYSERVFVIYITDSGNEEDIVKISDIKFIKDILFIYAYTGHITSRDIH